MFTLRNSVFGLFIETETYIFSYLRGSQAYLTNKPTKKVQIVSRSIVKPDDELFALTENRANAIFRNVFYPDRNFY